MEPISKLSNSSTKLTSSNAKINRPKVPWIVIPEAEQRGDIPPPRNCHSAGVYDNNMIIFGGSTRTTKLNDVYTFDLTTKTWTEVITKGEVPQKRYCHTGIILKNSFVIFGGLGNHSRFNDVHLLNLETMAWSKMDLPNSPEGRSHHSAVAYGNDKLIAFGGLADTGKRLNDVHILNLEKGTWTAVNTTGEPPSPRLAAGLAVWQNKLVVMGGYTGARRLNDLHILDLATQEWKSPIVSGQPASSRFGHTTTILANKLIIYGGSGNQRPANSDLYLLDLEYMEWTRLNSSRSPGHSYHSACITEEKNLIIYGNNDTENTGNNIYLLNTNLIDELRECTFDEAKNMIRNNLKKMNTMINNSTTHKEAEKIANDSLNLLKSQFRRLMDEESNLREQYRELETNKEIFAESKKKMEKYMDEISGRVKLNVGGLKYETTRSTLISEQGTMFSAMFSGRYPVKPEEDGYIFIDRNGTYFNYILDYLRNGTVYLPDDKVVLYNLYQEAEFFQLNGMLPLITKKLRKEKVSVEKVEDNILAVIGRHNSKQGLADEQN